MSVSKLCGGFKGDISESVKKEGIQTTEGLTCDVVTVQESGEEGVNTALVHLLLAHAPVVHVVEAKCSLLT